MDLPAYKCRFFVEDLCELFPISQFGLSSPDLEAARGSPISWLTGSLAPGGQTLESVN